MATPPQEPTVTITPEQLAALLAQAMRASKDPPRENAQYVEDNVYHPKGVEKKPFTRRYLQNGIPIHWKMCTPQEVELLEKLQPGDYHLLNGVPQWHVVAEDDGRLINLKFLDKDLEHRMSNPSLRAMLREIVDGTPAE